MDAHPILAAFHDLLQTPGLLPRWEEVLPVPWGGCRETDTIEIRLGGDFSSCDLAAVLAPALGPDYRPLTPWTPWRSWTGCFDSGSRQILLGVGALRLGVSGNARKRPVDDRGEQDALIAVFAGPHADAVQAVVADRSTDSHFEEPAARVLQGVEGLRLLRRLSESTVCISLEAEFFTGNANPYVGLRQSGEARLVIRSRPDREPSVRWIRPGVFELRAEAAATAFPEYRVMPTEVAHATVWCSPSFTLDARAPGRYRLRAGAPEERRLLDEGERLFFVSKGQQGRLGPREILEVSLLEVLPPRPRGMPVRHPRPAAHQKP